MALSRLDTEEMVHITSTWIVHGHPDHAALANEAALVPLLPAIDSAHQRLLDVHPKTFGALRRRTIRQRQQRIDESRDRTVRGIWHRLIATIEFTQDVQREAALRGLKQRLLPDGPGIVRPNYQTQADQAVLVASRLTEADWSLLASIPLMGGRSLRDAVEEWLALARDLASLESARLGRGDATQVSEDEISSARGQWIETIEEVRSAAATAKRPSQALLDVLARVSAIELRAERRAGTQAETSIARGGFEDVVDTLQITTSDIWAAMEEMRPGSSES
ncbi:hypothetical protein [Haliangium ochraceum]|uniref:Uncharacterized protein n=1 Tax=Haliangium ochraceum (strain DSM 14365 / JCM 11303 / SMP-2) TaxID=502025 RepID=D0LJ63_HALO1|nr:hypothetical protein [Haliangium ochraceum]ACY14910.1 hypothetical protein Hoch_2372 [Haliangium ochraceum DSM 14365]